MDVGKVVANRLFCNKMWNATKLTLQFTHTSDQRAKGTPPGLGRLHNLDSRDGCLMDRWILSRLASATAGVDEGITSFDIGGAAFAVRAAVLNYDIRLADV